MYSVARVTRAPETVSPIRQATASTHRHERAQSLPRSASNSTPERVSSPAIDASHARLGQKVRAFVGLAAHDAAYQRNVSFMAVTRVADALCSAAYLQVMQHCGSGGVTAAAEALGRTFDEAGNIPGCSHRDNVDMQGPPSSPTAEIARLSRGMAGAMGAESLLAVSLGATLATTGLRADYAALAAGIAVGVMLGRTVLSGYYFGEYNCVKPLLGDSEARRKQLEFNRTIGGIESIGFATISQLGGSFLYFMLRDKDPITSSLVALAVGLGLLSLTTGNFSWQGWRHATVDNVPPDDAPSSLSVARPDLLPLPGKLNAMGRLLAQDADYRKHAVILLLRRFGLGLTAASYFYGLNKAGNSTAVVAIGVPVELTRLGLFPVTNHGRETEEHLKEHSTIAERRADLTNRLARLGIADGIVSAMTVAGLALSNHSDLHWLALSLLAIGKVCDSAVRSFEVDDHWSRLKMYLGGAASRDNQRAISRTITAVEKTALRCMQSGVSIGAFALFNAVDASSSEHANALCVGAACLGSALAGTASGFLASEASHWKERHAEETQDGAPTETTPLLPQLSRTLTV